MRNLSRALKTSVEQFTQFDDVIYTERQLYYQVCRTLRPTPGLGENQVPKALLISALPALLFLRRPRLAAALMIAAALAIEGLHFVRYLHFTLTPPISCDDFRRELAGYQAEHGLLPGLLSADLSPAISLNAFEPDLFDYGLPRLLVCQQAEIAQMLLANDIHMDLSCPILSLAEATPLPAPLLAMLVRTPKARLFFLHDASPAGLALVPGLRDRLGLPKEIALTAMGLRPIHALRLHLFAAHHLPLASPLSTWPAYLKKVERRWLQAGWWAETDALHPVHLMRALRRIMLGSAGQRAQKLDLHREREMGFMTWPDWL